MTKRPGQSPGATPHHHHGPLPAQPPDQVKEELRKLCPRTAYGSGKCPNRGKPFVSFQFQKRTELQTIGTHITAATDTGVAPPQAPRAPSADCSGLTSICLSGRRRCKGCHPTSSTLSPLASGQVSPPSENPFFGFVKFF